jgi:hypothetical protein
MSLEIKSQENLAVVEYYVKAGKNINAVTGRAYYAAFQKIKHFLEAEGFDYGKYLSDIGKQDQKPYSHGTIKYALMNYLVQTWSIGLDEMKPFGFIDFLYHQRELADYSPMQVKMRDAESCVKHARSVVETIDALKNRRRRKK